MVFVIVLTSWHVFLWFEAPSDDFFNLAVNSFILGFSAAGLTYFFMYQAMLNAKDRHIQLIEDHGDWLLNEIMESRKRDHEESENK
jgi:ABC-type Fe3+ transport system permease subunit